MGTDLHALWKYSLTVSLSVVTIKNQSSWSKMAKSVTHTLWGGGGNHCPLRPAENHLKPTEGHLSQRCWDVFHTDSRPSRQIARILRSTEGLHRPAERFTGPEAALLSRRRAVSSWHLWGRSHTRAHYVDRGSFKVESHANSGPPYVIQDQFSLTADSLRSL